MFLCSHDLLTFQKLFQPHPPPSPLKKSDGRSLKVSNREERKNGRRIISMGKRCNRGQSQSLCTLSSDAQEFSFLRDKRTGGVGISIKLSETHL